MYRLSVFIPEPIVRVCERLQQAQHQAFVVGGAIRDLLLGNTDTAQDFDIATSAQPEQVMELFGHTRALPTGLQHGTVTVLLPPTRAVTKHTHVEVTTFRGEEGYRDGRRPDRVVFLKAIEEDLQRRDFTINAIAYDPLRDHMVDPFGGQRDLERRCIRAVGTPQLRFQEDGLRLLRGVRFSAQLGFLVEPATAQAMSLCIHMLRYISRERIRDELHKLLKGVHVAKGLSLLYHSGILGCIAPVWEKMTFGETLATIVLVSALPKEATLRLAGLFFTLYRLDPKETMQTVVSLKLSNHEQARIQAAWQVPALEQITSLTPVELRRFASRFSQTTYKDAWMLQDAVFFSQGCERLLFPRKTLVAFREQLDMVLRQKPPLTLKDLALTGTDITEALRVQPGKRVGEALHWLLERVLEDPGRNTKETLLSLLATHYPQA